MLDMELEESLELILNVIANYYEERDYLLYVNSLIFYEKIPSYNEFRKQFKSTLSQSTKLTKHDKEERRKENSKILKSFLNKENYEEVNLNVRGF